MIAAMLDLCCSGPHGDHVDRGAGVLITLTRAIRTALTVDAFELLREALIRVDPREFFS